MLNFPGVCVCVCVCAVRRLVLCEELDRSSCGSVLFHGYLPPPGKNTMQKTHPEVFCPISCLTLSSVASKLRVLYSTAVPVRKSSPASAASCSSSDSRPVSIGAEGFPRAGPPPHPSLSDSPGTDDNNKLGQSRYASEITANTVAQNMGE